jgi:hypothetical protein
MIKLYRGLIDILIYNSRQMDEMFTKHVREDVPNNTGDFGVSGFWNLLLEVTFLLFTKMFIACGVLLAVSLALVFFPLHAMRIAIVNMLNHRAEPFPVEQPPINTEKTNGNTKKEK